MASSVFTNPAGLDLITQVKVKFMAAYEAAYASKRAYSDYTKFVFAEDPTGDQIYLVYSHPLGGMQEWKNERPVDQATFKFIELNVRKFATGLKIDVDDIRDDANPAKAAQYLAAAQRLGESTVLLWPDLVAQAMNNGVVAIWKPDGQHILDNHPFDPDDSSKGTYRNYWSKTVQGGGASMPLTYGNLLARIKQGYTFKLPNGRVYPIEYNKLVVEPSLFPAAQRLATYDKLPVGEIFGQTLGTTAVGGEAENEIKKYGLEVCQLAGLNANWWSLMDTTMDSSKPIGLKKRQAVTWQYTGTGNGPGGLPNNDEGLISERAYHSNQVEYGPKARGEAFVRQWWGLLVCDGTP